MTDIVWPGKSSFSMLYIHVWCKIFHYDGVETARESNNDKWQQNIIFQECPQSDLNPG